LIGVKERTKSGFLLKLPRGKRTLNRRKKGEKSYVRSESTVWRNEKSGLRTVRGSK